jgi:aldehyde:ferredoxin oxidoreductase
VAYKGRTGNILFIDLSTRKSYLENTNKYITYIGGRGINQRILFDSVSENTDPLDSQNPILLGSGPFVGTLVPGASRLAVDFKNVLNNGIGSGNSGSHFAAEMKYAGYDNIIITGQSKKPAYIFIHNQKIYFRDATELWGLNTWETENQIRIKEDDSQIKTLCIGLAGENLVKFSVLVADKGRFVGYGGGGALFGSKKLKAIAIRGTLPLKVAYPEELFRKAINFNKKIINKSKAVQNHRKGGTLLPYTIPGENRPHAVRNMSDGFWPNDKIQQISREKIDKQYTIRKNSCFNCPMYCSNIYQINGKYFEGFQANSFRSFASNVDCSSLPDVINAHALTNLYGLDGDHTSNIIAWAIECYENGILTKEDTDNLELTWGNGKAIIKLVEKIAYRRGFGDILANGIYEAMNIIGRGSSKYAVLVKKNALMEAAMRSHKAWALGILTSAKGGGHLRGAPIQEMQNILPSVSKELFGLGDISLPTSYQNKAALVIWQENYKAILDCLGLCALMSMWTDVNIYRLDDIKEFYYLVTGEDVSIDKFKEIGSRINNLERSFNLLHAGFDRKDDLPPTKLTEIPVSQGTYQGERLEINQWNQLLDEYYQIHGWNIESGRPTREVLAALDLEDVIEKLEQKNLI